MEIDVHPGVAEALAKVREGSLSVDLTLQMCGGLVIKDAVAYPGPSDEEAGFRVVRVGDLDLYWRQRLLVEGASSASVTERVRPRRLEVRTDGDAFSAEASYA